MKKREWKQLADQLELSNVRLLRERGAALAECRRLHKDLKECCADRAGKVDELFALREELKDADAVAGSYRLDAEYLRPKVESLTYEYTQLCKALGYQPGGLDLMESAAGNIVKERDAAKADYMAVAVAAGIYHEADGIDAKPGPVAAVVGEINRKARIRDEALNDRDAAATECERWKGIAATNLESFKKAYEVNADVIEQARRMRPVVEAACDWLRSYRSAGPAMICHLIGAVDTYRASASHEDHEADIPTDAPGAVWCEPDPDTGWACEVGGWTPTRQLASAVQYVRADECIVLHTSHTSHPYVVDMTCPECGRVVKCEPLPEALEHPANKMARDQVRAIDTDDAPDCPNCNYLPPVDDRCVSCDKASAAILNEGGK